jgi:hypothetical protein
VPLATAADEFAWFPVEVSHWKVSVCAVSSLDDAVHSME